jgi:hypothetical protein
VENFTSLAKVTTESLASGFNVDQPAVIMVKELQDKWITDHTMQQVFTGFGGRYQKMDTFKAENKSTVTFSTKQGKEPTEDFFSKLFDAMKKQPMNIAPVSVHFNSTSWLFGYGQSWNCSALSPNSAAVFRFLAMGAVETWAINPTTFIEACKQLNNKVCDLEAFKNTVTGLTTDVVKQLMSKGAEIYYHKLEHEQLIYIPCGWFVVERATDCMVMYGARKSVFFDTVSAKLSYQSAKLLLDGSGQSTGKMDALLNIFTSKPESK